MTQPATVRTVPRGARLHGARPQGRGCFDDPHFLAAACEMEALGLHVSAAPHPDSVPFDVLGGRAHLRWFLIPPQPRSVRFASLALIQPQRRAARLFKRTLSSAVGFGLPLPWRDATAHVSGVARAARAFGIDASQAAFLTGTASPHRKLTVQWMDDCGAIKAYAKVARTPAVQALLANEAAVLEQLRIIHLSAAAVPRMLSRELRNGAMVLVTDTVRTTRHACCTRLDVAHLTLLDELAAATGSSPRRPDGEELLRHLRVQVAGLATGLSAAWRQRFDRALEGLAFAPDLIAPRGLAHGDFTPVNTFRYGNRVFVFDWEYAGYAYPADYDLIHFLFAMRRTQRSKPADDCLTIESILTRELGRPPAAARARLAAYLCAQALLLAGRRAGQDGSAPVLEGHVLEGQILEGRISKGETWEGERAAALMLDALSARGRAGW